MEGVVFVNLLQLLLKNCEILLVDILLQLLSKVVLLLLQELGFGLLHFLPFVKLLFSGVKRLCLGL